MPTASPIQTNFTSGEFSPLLRGRVDLEQYGNAAAELMNVQVLTAGGATKRSGSYYVVTQKTSASRVVLRSFTVSNVAAYVLEIGDGYTRFYRNRAQLIVGAVALELATPWAESELRQLRFAQSVDVLFIFHVAHQTRKISRTSAGEFQIALAVFEDGPYAEENTGDVGAALPSPGGSGAETGTGGGGAGGSDTSPGGPPEGNAGGEGPSGGFEGGEGGHEDGHEG